MKKIIVLSTIAFGCVFTVSAQKLKDTKVPAAVKAAFMKANPNTAVTWEKEDGNYEAVYSHGGKVTSSVITKGGNILSTETEMSMAELPANIQSYVKTNYKKAKTKGAAKIVNADGSVEYEISVNGKELMFDSNAKLLKKAKEEKD